MTAPISEARRLRAISLRVERQLSAPEIARRVGICHHTAYKILRPYPWTGCTVKKTDWTVAEVNVLIRLWPTAKRGEIERALPRRRWTSISKKAGLLGLRRPTGAYRREGANAHPVVAKLEKIRRADGIKRPAISRRSGIHVNQLCLWALGRAMPRFDKVCAWAEAMGCEIVVRRKT